MCKDQLEFDFGPEFPRVQVRRDQQLYDIVLDMELAIARADYLALTNALGSLRHRVWDMFWGALRVDPK